MPKKTVQSLIQEYESYRRRTLNLISSENILSADVLRALSSPMAGRYAGRPESYGGSGNFHEIWRRCEELASEVFDCKAASVAPISGHVSAIMALDSVCQRGDRIATLSADSGGYRGYTSGYVPEVLGLDVSYLPFDRTTWNVDLGSALRMVREDRPRVVVLGGTIFLFPHPVKEIAEAVHSYGGRVIYDGSHVMGLVAGGSFQDPLKDGADLLLGSTHKTFFGPQGGMVVSNDEELLGRLEARYLYRFVDNFQLNRVAALGIALEEARQHARMYSRRVIDNAKALANELSALGLPVAGKPVGFTESHQVLMPFGNDGGSIRNKLEPSGVIVDSMVRLGTNEVTRRGMGTKEMTTVAGLIRRALSTQTDPKVKKEVAALANRFGKVHYTLKERFSTKKQIH